MNALILAAGFGTRMYPFTENTPKSLIKINNKPVLDFMIENLEKVKDIKNIYLITNNKFYIDFLEWKKGRKIKIINNGINDKKDKKGAIADLKSALKIMDKDDLFIFAADNLFDFNLEEMMNLSKEKKSSVVALKIIKDIEKVKKFNHIFLDKENKIIFFEEKPQEPRSNICSTACFYVTKQDLEKIENNNFENADNIGEIVGFLQKKSIIYGRVFDEFWCDIGSIEDINKAENYFHSAWK